MSEDPAALSPTRLIWDTLALVQQQWRWVLGLSLAVALIRLGTAAFLLLPNPTLGIALSVLTNMGAQTGLSIYLMQRVATELRVPGQAPLGLAESLGTVIPRIILMGLMAALSAVVVSTGLVLLLIPGLYLALSTSLAPAIVAVEGRGPLASLRLSHELVKGYRLRLLGTLLPLGGSVILAVLVLSNLLDGVISNVPSPISVVFGITVTTATMSAVSVYELGLVLAYQRLMERQPARGRHRG
ncbi:hypothetical protein LXT21_38740 [Myxococcus sp. K38C18041901]|uniref:hypothetical protein n=1 Tax=Myxococcus guangdongensis TaxID=2906760 RepID=UPI0020A751B8|nr:hypothetical protein [Myxococcus guangdongensis]MCP3064726.1 hypothetical protein [Myxococcus guangdongensis]